MIYKDLIVTYTGSDLSLFGKHNRVASVDNTLFVKFITYRNRRNKGFLLKYEVKVGNWRKAFFFVNYIHLFIFLFLIIAMTANNNNTKSDKERKSQKRKKWRNVRRWIVQKKLADKLTSCNNMAATPTTTKFAIVTKARLVSISQSVPKTENFYRLRICCDHLRCICSVTEKTRRSFFQRLLLMA